MYGPPLLCLHFNTYSFCCNHTPALIVLRINLSQVYHDQHRPCGTGSLTRRPSTRISAEQNFTPQRGRYDFGVKVRLCEYCLHRSVIAYLCALHNANLARTVPVTRMRSYMYICSALAVV